MCVSVATFLSNDIQYVYGGHWPLYPFYEGYSCAKCFTIPPKKAQTKRLAKMSKEKKIMSMRENLREKLCKLFLHTFISKPQLIRWQILKHLEVPEENVVLREERNVTDDDGNVLYSLFTLLIFEYEYILRFDKRVEQPKDIDVPKVVKTDKKWWEFRKPNHEVVIEKKPSIERPLTHWLLSSIE